MIQHHWGSVRGWPGLSTVQGSACTVNSQGADDSEGATGPLLGRLCVPADPTQRAALGKGRSPPLPPKHPPSPIWTVQSVQMFGLFNQIHHTGDPPRNVWKRRLKCYLKQFLTCRVLMANQCILLFRQRNPASDFVVRQKRRKPTLVTWQKLKLIWKLKLNLQIKMSAVSSGCALKAPYYH